VPDIQSWLRYFFLFSLNGVRLSPLGTSATNWPIVPAQDDRRWVWGSRWKENWQGKPKYSERTCPSITLSTTNLMWPDLGSNPGRRGGKPATNRTAAWLRQMTVSVQPDLERCRTEEWGNKDPWNVGNACHFYMMPSPQKWINICAEPPWISQIICNCTKITCN
jgi:hypothetical protein